jgi:ATP-binding cassette subfamily B protein IrtA
LAGVRKMAPILALSEVQSTSEYKLDNQLDNEQDNKISVEFSDLAFSYQDREILKGINLTLLPGTFTVLLGPSGARKTTMAQLLAGLLLPSSGAVTINGKALTAYGNEQRSQLIAVATQQAFLFKGTIKDNLLLARPLATDVEINLALKVAQAGECVESLPNGLNTKIHEQGVRLSGGEKQHIAIARAFLANTPVLVLDEAASLDNLTQQAFYRDIKHYYPEKTILVVAHRSYGVETADQIVVLEQGIISGIGQQEQLILENTFYKWLWLCQVENEHWARGKQQNNSQTLFQGVADV